MMSRNAGGYAIRDEEQHTHDIGVPAVPVRVERATMSLSVRKAED